MLDVMLDLETMGTGPSAAIVAIGAVEFDLDTGQLGSRFYEAVDLCTSVELGGVIDAATVLWWMDQSDAARAAFRRGGIHICVALGRFTEWLLSRDRTEGTARIWGNGAGFDNVVLASAYRAARRPQPWKFYNDRCYRTIKALLPQVELVRVGEHHKADDDAESQARHLIRIVHSIANVLVNADERASRIESLTEEQASLAKFYGVATLAEIVDAQAGHIASLQAKLPKGPADYWAPQSPRVG